MACAHVERAHPEYTLWDAPKSPCLLSRHLFLVGLGLLLDVRVWAVLPVAASRCARIVRAEPQLPPHIARAELHLGRHAQRASPH